MENTHPIGTWLLLICSLAFSFEKQDSTYPLETTIKKLQHPIVQLIIEKKSTTIFKINIFKWAMRIKLTKNRPIKLMSQRQLVLQRPAKSTIDEEKIV